MADPTAAQLASPTIGAIRRARGHTGWAPEAQHLFAVTAVTEALRAAIVDRLEDITRTAVVLTPDQTIGRIARLLTDYHQALS